MLKKAKILQSVAGLLVMLSLFASSIVACACTHHGETVVKKTTAACHSDYSVHGGEHQISESYTDISALACEAICICAPAQQQVSAKSEITKIEKQAAAISVVLKEAEFVSEQTVATNHFFERAEYLTDSFYNLKPGRAPPSRL